VRHLWDCPACEGTRALPADFLLTFGPDLAVQHSRKQSSAPGAIQHKRCKRRARQPSSSPPDSAASAVAFRVDCTHNASWHVLVSWVEMEQQARAHLAEHAPDLLTLPAT
jgi:hypothetical protein